MPLNYHSVVTTSLVCGLGLAGCVSTGVPGGPSLIRIKEPPSTQLYPAEAASEQRLQSLLQACIRIDHRLSAPPPPAPLPADLPATARSWSLAVEELLTLTSPESRLGAIATLSDLLPYAQMAEDRANWARYLRLVVALEHALLDTELQLHRRLAPSTGSVHEAARRRSESFMADGPSVISAREGRISARALGGGVPITPADLARGRELARELRRLGFYVTAARPIPPGAEPLSGAIPQPAFKHIPGNAPDALRRLAQTDARRLFLAQTDAEAEWSLTLARIQAQASVTILDETYLLHRERMFAPLYREIKSRLSVASP